MRYLRWAARRLLQGGLACNYQWCGHRQVGYSAWCREHTDRIMADENIDVWPRRRNARVLYMCRGWYE